jgi:CheY-like chemotaxis protein
MVSVSDAGSKNTDRKVLAGRRFLVVDDQAYMIDVICEMLRHFGADDLIRAENAEAALARCGPKSVFDCIICDFNMKPVSGLQLLQAIRIGRRAGVARDQRFMLVTGHGELDVVKVARALDVSSYVVKPVAPDTFLKAVTRALTTSFTLRTASDYEKVSTQDLKRFQ